MIIKIFGEKIKNNHKPELEYCKYWGCLVLDVYGAHITENVYKTADQYHIHLVIVPANGTGKYQPNDIGIFGPFKMIFKSFFRNWILNLPQETTFPNLKIKPENLFLWLSKSIEKIKNSPEIILKAWDFDFLKYDISHYHIANIEKNQNKINHSNNLNSDQISNQYNEIEQQNIDTTYENVDNLNSNNINDDNNKLMEHVVINFSEELKKSSEEYQKNKNIQRKSIPEEIKITSLSTCLNIFLTTTKEGKEIFEEGYVPILLQAEQKYRPICLGGGRTKGSRVYNGLNKVQRDQIKIMKQQINYYSKVISQAAINQYFTIINSINSYYKQLSIELKNPSLITESKTKIKNDLLPLFSNYYTITKNLKKEYLQNIRKDLISEINYHNSKMIEIFKNQNSNDESRLIQTLKYSSQHLDSLKIKNFDILENYNIDISIKKFQDSKISFLFKIQNETDDIQSNIEQLIDNFNLQLNLPIEQIDKIPLITFQEEQIGNIDTISFDENNDIILSSENTENIDFKLTNNNQKEILVDSSNNKTLQSDFSNNDSIEIINHSFKSNYPSPDSDSSFNNFNPKLNEFDNENFSNYFNNEILQLKSLNSHYFNKELTYLNQSNNSIKGIFNYGSTCYINSCIKILFNIPRFSQLIFAADKNGLIPSLQKIYFDLNNHSTSFDYIYINHFFNYLGWPRHVLNIPNDCVNFMFDLLSCLEGYIHFEKFYKFEISNSYERTIKKSIDPHFSVGSTVVQTTTTQENFLFITSTWTDFANNFAFNDLTNSDNITSSDYPGLEFSSVFYYSQIYNFPNILFLQFPKNNINSIPFKINLKDLCHFSKLNQDISLYYLQSYVLFSGEDNFGHYSVVIKKDNSWFHHSDLNITQISMENIGNIKDNIILAVYIREDELNMQFYQSNSVKIDFNRNKIKKYQTFKFYSTPRHPIQINTINPKNSQLILAEAQKVMTDQLFQKFSQNFNHISIYYIDCSDYNVNGLKNNSWLMDCYINSALFHFWKDRLIKNASFVPTEFSQYLSRSEIPKIECGKYFSQIFYNNILIIPFQEANHWYLININTLKHIINVYDSKANNSLNINKLLLTLEKLGFPQFEIIYPINTLQQNNSYDCGLFILKYASLIFQNKESDIQHVTEAEMEQYRQEIADICQEEYFAYFKGKYTSNPMIIY